MFTQPLRLLTGEEHIVALRGLGSVGYAWQATVEEGLGVVDVVKRDAEGPPAEPGAVRTTAEAEVLFVIRALRPGRARVRFVMRRPWMKSSGGLATREEAVDVEVQDA